MKIYKRAEFWFCLRFLFSFISLYGFNLAFIGLINPGGLYSSFLREQLDFIEGWKNILLRGSATAIKLMGYQPNLILNHLSVEGRGGIILSYSCLGYGVCSFFTALICTLPGSLKNKLLAVLTGCLLIQVLNMSRIVLLCLYWRDSILSRIIPHHLLFDLLIYGIVMGLVMLWTKKYSGINSTP